MSQINFPSQMRLWDLVRILRWHGLELKYKNFKLEIVRNG